MVLHIHNGDATADIAKKSSIPGEHFAWREALIEGPAPAGVNAAEWRRRRAQHLAEAYGEEWNTCEQELVVQEERLASFSNYDEVVLWFEHDLFCQANLLYLLNWFAQQQLGNTKLSLVCIDSFPGKENLRGLGELNAGELNSLFPGRKPVTRDQLDLAARAWEGIQFTRSSRHSIAHPDRHNCVAFPWPGIESAFAAVSLHQERTRSD